MREIGRPCLAVLTSCQLKPELGLPSYAALELKCSALPCIKTLPAASSNFAYSGDTHG